MTEEELRAAFARHESSTPPVGPLRAAIDRVAAQRRRRRTRVRATGLALAAVCAVAVGVPVVAGGGPTSLGGGQATETGVRTPAVPLNFLLLGLDGAARAGVARADSVLIVHVPADRSRLYLVSLPRDLEVPVAGAEPRKLSAVYAESGTEARRPDPSAGWTETVRAVTALTRVPIDGGAVLTYPAVRGVVDAVDGLPVCLPRQTRSWHSGRVFPAGCQQLDGAGTVDLLRQRSGLPGGALDRDHHARLVVAALVDRVGDRDLHTDPAALVALLAVLGRESVLETGGRSPIELVRLVGTAADAEPVGIALPTSSQRSAGGAAHERLDERAAPALLAALRADRLAEWVRANPDRADR